jgi:hypothetical protein
MQRTGLPLKTNSNSIPISNAIPIIKETNEWKMHKLKPLEFGGEITHA